MKNYNLSTLKAIGEGSEEFILKMVSAFIRNTPETILEIKDCLKKNEFADLAKHAHKIKPSIDLMEIDALKSVIREVESKAKKSDSDGLERLIQYLENKVLEVIVEVKKEYPNLRLD